MATVGFVLLAGLVVLTSGLVVVARNLVHAVFWLAGTLIVSSALMIWLGATFVAGVQIVLYTGGVMALMLVTVMLTNRGDATNDVPNPVQRPGTAALASMTLLAIVLGAIWTTPEIRPDAVAVRAVPAMRTLEADLLIERDLELLEPEEPPAAIVDDEEATSELAFQAPSVEDQRDGAFVELRQRIEQPLAEARGAEISANDDAFEPTARIWVALDDRSPASREAAIARLEAAGVRVVSFDTTAEIGRELLTDHLLAFEALSVLLLAAMIGAIVLSRRKDP